MHQASDTVTTKPFDPHNAEGELYNIEGAAKALCIMASNEESGCRYFDGALYYIANQIERHCVELRRRMYPETDEVRS